MNRTIKGERESGQYGQGSKAAQGQQINGDRQYPNEYFRKEVHSDGKLQGFGSPAL